MPCIKTTFALLALAIVTLPRAGSADEPPFKWARRIDDAQRIAAGEKKDLLINFTGSEWCFNCTLLDRAVLSRKEFADAARDFVLVELDFPNERSRLGELMELYLKWERHYLIQGYPTVVLADAAGRPYAYFVGYEEGVTPADFLEHLRKARQTRVVRDRQLAAAQEATGALRAQKLHAAISAVAGALGSVEDHGEDPVLALYHEEVEEIRRLDSENSKGLRAVYDARIAAQDDYRRRQAEFKELEKFSAKADWPAAIAYLDKRLPEVADGEIRFQLERRRAAYLEWNEQFAEALETVRRLVNDPRCPPGDRRHLLFSEAMCLRRLGRIDEAVVSFDLQIAAAADRPSERLSLMKRRAEILLASARRADAVAAYQALRAACKPDSPEWAEASGMLAIALARNGQHRESIALRQEQIEHSRRSGSSELVPFHFLEIARSQHALGLDDKARQSLEELEQAIPTAADKPQQQNLIDGLRKDLVKMRQTIEPTK